MPSKKRPMTIFTLWEDHAPKIVAAIVASAAIITGAALYLNLPWRVEAEEKKNAEQEVVLSHLESIEQQNSAILKWIVQQRQAPQPVERPPVLVPPALGESRTCFDKQWQAIPCP